MVKLTEKLVLARARANDLSGVKTLNCWGNDLDDVEVLEDLENVEVINFSANSIKSLKAFSKCSKLRELYLRRNAIENFEEIEHLVNLKNLKLLWLSGNPFCEKMSDEEYRLNVIKTLPQLQKLDNTNISSEEVQLALQSCLSGEEENEDPECSKTPDVPPLGPSPDEGGEPNLAAMSQKYQSAAKMSLYETNELRAQLGLKEINPERFETPKSFPYKPFKKTKPIVKENNVLTATLALIKDLDVDSLRVVQDSVSDRITLLDTQLIQEPKLKMSPLQNTQQDEELPVVGQVEIMKNKLQKVLEAG